MMLCNDARRSRDLVRGVCLWLRHFEKSPFSCSRAFRLYAWCQLLYMHVKRQTVFVLSHLLSVFDVYHIID